MRLAYIISAYKLPEQLVRLIHRLQKDCSNGDSSIFVHIDKKADDELYAKVVSGVSHMQNVFFLKRYRCNWGDFGHVQATLEGIAEIVRRQTPFDYAVLLTGQDYPIKSRQQICQFFQDHDGKLFMENFLLPSSEWEGGGLQRAEHWYLWFKQRRFVFPSVQAGWPKRHFPTGFKPYGGSSYWCLPRESIYYLDRFVAENTGFVRFFRYADVPDELFFQTILMNSPFKDDVVNDNLRYIDWKDPNSGSPAVLGRDDFQKLVESPKLFARKFDPQVDSAVLDLIDQRILQYAAA